MTTLTTLLVLLVAVEHIAFMVLEMFFWTKPLGRRVLFPVVFHVPFHAPLIVKSSVKDNVKCVVKNDVIKACEGLGDSSRRR